MCARKYRSNNGIANQIMFECKKVMKKRITFLFFICILGAGMLYFLGVCANVNLGSRIDANAYQRVSEEIRQVKDEVEYLKWQGEYESMLFEGTLPHELYTNSIMNEYYLYKQIAGELEQVTGYKDYILNILANAEEQPVGIYANNHDESIKKQRIYADYVNLLDVKTHFAGSYGINVFMETDFWDLAMVIVLLVLVHAIVLTEFEDEKILLIRVTKNGRNKTIASKLICGGLIILAMQVLMYSYRLLIVGLTFGMPYLGESFQSVYGASACSLKVNIGEALLIFVTLKILAMLSLFSLFTTCAILFKNLWNYYIGTIFVMGISWILFQQIDSNSFFAFLKWINPSSILATDTIVMQYHLLILFGHPVQYRVLVVFLCIILSIFCSSLTITLFCFSMPLNQGGRVRESGVLQNGIFHDISVTNTLMGYEIKKWILYQNGFWICVFFSIVMFFLYEPVSQNLYGAEEIFYRYYVKQVEGAYTDEKMDLLYSEADRLAEINEDLEVNGSKYEASVLNYYNEELEKKAGLEKAIQYGIYLEKTGGSFLYEKGYETLLGLKDGAFKLFMYRGISLFFMAILSALIWNIEQSSGMNRLICISRIGHKKVDHVKRWNIILVGGIVSIIVYVPWAYSVFSKYGAFGLFSPANSLQMFFGVPLQINLAEVLIAFYLVHLIYLWIVGEMMSFFCKKCKNGMIAIATLTCLGLIPLILIYGLS